MIRQIPNTNMWRCTRCGRMLARKVHRCDASSVLDVLDKLLGCSNRLSGDQRVALAAMELTEVTDAAVAIVTQSVSDELAARRFLRAAIKEFNDADLQQNNSAAVGEQPGDVPVGRRAQADSRHRV